MRAQISVELLIYLSLAGLSFLSCVTLLKSFYPNLLNSIDSYELSNFVSSVNLGLLSERAFTNFSFYLPKNFCNVSSSSLNLNFVKPVFIARSPTCSNPSKISLVLFKNGTNLVVIQ